MSGNEPLLLGIWYSKTGFTKMRFCADGKVHSRTCPYPLNRTRMDSFIHQSYALENGVLTLTPFNAWHRNADGLKVMTKIEQASYSLSHISTLTPDALVFDGLKMIREGEVVWESDKPIELSRRNRTA